MLPIPDQAVRQDDDRLAGACSAARLCPPICCLSTSAIPVASPGAILPATLRAALCAILGAALFAAQPASAEVRLEINGLPEALEDNVRAVVGALPADETRPVRRFLRDLDANTRTALSALGYYAADIDISTADVISTAGATEVNPDGRDVVITVDATPNDPVRVNSIDIDVAGSALGDDEFMKRLTDLPLREGDVFLSADYESIKTDVLSAAQDRGYFDLEFQVSEVSVSRQNLTANIEIAIDSGERYTFGNVLFDEEVFSDEFLNRWLTFAPGDQFELEKIGESTDNLRGSQYFDSVRVIPQRDERYGKVVPVQVSLQNRDNNQVGIGIGYQTDIGPRVSLSWEKPLINRFGHSAAVDFEVSETRQSVGFNYRIPRKDQPLTNYWGAEAGVLNEDFSEDDVSYNKTTLAVQRVTRTTHDFEQSLFLRWEHERSTVSDVDDTVDLLLPGVSYSRSRTHGKPHTTWGQSERFSIYSGSDELLSTIDFLKTTLNFRFLREFSDKNYFIGAIGLGWIESNDFDRVPASQRFFAGGDRSVRGFRYRDISPINADGDAVGGRYLEEFTIEYNRRFRDQFRWATFIDTGRAFNNYDTRYSAGAGIGFRWQSPVGSFKLDVARPVSNGDGNTPRLHISLGSDL